MKTFTLRSATALGLPIAFFGAPLIVFIANQYATEVYTDQFVIIKESIILSMAGILIWLILKKENLSLKSIGLHNNHWGRSILFGVGIAVVLIAVLLVMVYILSLFDLQIGGGVAHRYDSISLWTMTLVVFRAGFVEELCYRGYIMERMHSLSNGNWYMYFLLPLIIFAIAHYEQGIQGIIISFIAALILAFFYWKNRDLKANMIAHFLVDLIPNVIIPLLG